MESKNRNGLKKFGGKILALSMLTGISLCSLQFNEAKAVNPVKPTGGGNLGTSRPTSPSRPTSVTRPTTLGNGWSGIDFSEIKVPNNGGAPLNARPQNPSVLDGIAKQLGEKMAPFIVKQ